MVPKLAVSGELEYRAYLSGSAVVTHALCSLSAPEIPEEAEDKRPGLDIVAAIDKSGSMASENKLEYVKKTLQFLIDKIMRDRDSCGIVLFDSNVATLSDMKRMTAGVRQQVSALVAREQPGTCTNLSGGLLQSLEMLLGMAVANKVASVLLFTDGLANEGITDTTQLQNAVRTMLERKKIADRRITVHCFGYGKDHNASMLRCISEVGGGMYFFINGPDEIPTAFASCIGGISSVVAQNISLVVTPQNGAVIKSVRTKYTNEKRGDGSVKVTFGDLFAEEKRDVVVELELPQRAEERGSEAALQLSASYFNVLTTQSEISTPVTLSCERPAMVPVNQRRPLELVHQIARLDVADALQAATKLADDKKLPEARSVLSAVRVRVVAAIDELKAASGNTTAADPYLTALLKDIDDTLGGMREQREYQERGSKMGHAQYQAHSAQRGNRSVSAAEDEFGAAAGADSASYQTKARSKMQSQFKNFFQ